MRAKLVKAAKGHGIKLRQSYVRKAREALVMANRYFHARQYKRARRQVRKLKTYLQRVTNDIRRRIAGDHALKEAFSELIALADRVLAQQQTDKSKLYSLHAPEVECISKGKVHKNTNLATRFQLSALQRLGWSSACLRITGTLTTVIPYKGSSRNATGG